MPLLPPPQVVVHPADLVIDAFGTFLGKRSERMVVRWRAGEGERERLEVRRKTLVAQEEVEGAVVAFPGRCAEASDGAPHPSPLPEKGGEGEGVEDAGRARHPADRAAAQ